MRIVFRRNDKIDVGKVYGFNDLINMLCLFELKDIVSCYFFFIVLMLCDKMLENLVKMVKVERNNFFLVIIMKFGCSLE